MTFKGKGARLDVPLLPLTQPVTAQLHNGLACWQTAHGAPALRNDAGQFSDRADAP